MARVKPEEPRIETDEFRRVTKQYIFIKKQTDALEKESKQLREEIFDYIEENGEVDSKGNIFVEFDGNIEEFVGVQKTRRVKRVIDEEVAARIIQAKGLEDELYKTIRVVDEDALMAALYSEKLTEGEVDEMYPENVTWALNLNKK